MSGVELVDWCNKNLVIAIGMPCGAVQRNITDTTAAEIKGEFAFPVKAGLCLGSEPHKLGNELQGCWVSFRMG